MSSESEQTQARADAWHKLRIRDLWPTTLSREEGCALVAEHEALLADLAAAKRERDEARKALWSDRGAWLDDNLALEARAERLPVALARAAYVARNLLDLVADDDLSDVQHEGHHEGRYRAARLAEEIAEWAALAAAGGGHDRPDNASAEGGQQ
jgi:hypothetical protein